MTDFFTTEPSTEVTASQQVVKEANSVMQRIIGLLADQQVSDEPAPVPQASPAPVIEPVPVQPINSVSAASIKVKIVPISAQQLNSLSSSQRKQVNCATITPEMMKSLGSQNSSFLQSLGANAAGLPIATIRAMTDQQIRMLPESAVSEMSSAQLNGLSITATKSLPTSGITGNQIRRLESDSNLIATYFTGFVPELGANSAGLNNDAVSSFSGRQLDCLSSVATAALQVRAITVNQIKAAGWGLFSFVSELGTNARYLSSEAIGAFSFLQTLSLSKITSDSIKAKNTFSAQLLSQSISTFNIATSSSSAPLASSGSLIKITA